MFLLVVVLSGLRWPYKFFSVNLGADAGHVIPFLP